MQSFEMHDPPIRLLLESWEESCLKPRQRVQDYPHIGNWGFLWTWPSPYIDHAEARVYTKLGIIVLYHENTNCKD